MDASAFLDPQRFARIQAQAAASMGNATRAIMVLGYTFAPWLRSYVGKQIVTALVGALIGRHAQKKVALALQAESERVEAGTVWSQATPRESVAVAGVLPVGTRVPMEGKAEQMRIGGVSFPVPIFFRAILPPEPWTFRDRAEFMARFLRPSVATTAGKLPRCGPVYARRQDGQTTVYGVPCRV